MRRGLRGNTKGSKKALKNTGRCRFVVDQEHPFPATAAGRDAAEAKAIALAARTGGSIRIDLACLRSWEGGEPLKLRALVAKCNPSGCSEPGEGMHGLRGRSPRLKYPMPKKGFYTVESGYDSKSRKIVAKTLRAAKRKAERLVEETGHRACIRRVSRNTSAQVMCIPTWREFQWEQWQETKRRARGKR